jgi:hypothetical protein
MKFLNCVLLTMLIVLTALFAPAARAQTKPAQAAPAAPAAPAGSGAEKKNTDAYIALLRRNVRQEKAEIMGSMMALNSQDSAKFWPIYSDYDAQLIKLNDLRLANIKEYAQNYNQMTDDEADKLIQNAMSYRKQRAELFASTYEKLKQALGGITAARFAQVEEQLLLIIDLQIDTSLPIVGQGS